MGETPVEVLDRRPIEFREATGDIAGERAQPLAQSTILGDIAARRGGDLQKADSATVLGIPFEKGREGFEPVLQPLAIVEAVDPDDQLLIAEACSKRRKVRDLTPGTRHFGDRLGIDADRKHAGANRPAESANPAIGQDLAARAADNGIVKCGQVVDRLESDEIVGAQRLQQLS